jgi:hypothetical protein
MALVAAQRRKRMQAVGALVIAVVLVLCVALWAMRRG